jgi:hypothetical protein
MKQAVRTAQQGLGWFIFASGNLAGVAMLIHGLSA